MAQALEITDPEFWRLPLAERMAQFAVWREEGPFHRAVLPTMFAGPDGVDFHAVTRYAEVVEISRRPLDFCSGRGSTSIPDMPAEAMEFFGSFIAMDDPRHARQRGIVARSFTPRQLAVGARLGRRRSAPRSSTTSASRARSTSCRRSRSRSRC